MCNKADIVFLFIYFPEKCFASLAHFQQSDEFLVQNRITCLIEITHQLLYLLAVPFQVLQKYTIC